MRSVVSGGQNLFNIYQFLVRSFDTDDSQDLRRPHGTFSLADNQSAKVGVNTTQNVPLGERTSFWFPPLLVLPPFPCGMERLLSLIHI